MKRKNNDKNSSSFRVNLITNFVLGILVLSVGALCFAPTQSVAGNGEQETEVYRGADASSNSVSLMFNVYWGTDEVYKILEILKKHDAKATFFIGGCWADDNVKCLRQIYIDGHEIGNHGYFHKDHSKLSIQDNQKEISACNRYIELALGAPPTLFAPPSGAYGEEMLSACKTLNMKTILWSRDTIDWRDKNSAIIYTRATKNIKGGEFVLMHPMPATVDALEDVLRAYEAKSLTLATVSENLQL